MEVTRSQKGDYSVSVSEHELVAIANCLNEVTNGIERYEFGTRVSASIEEVAAMLDLISGVLDDRKVR